MSDTDDKINRLAARLDKMVEYQDYFYRETNQIRDEIKSLKQTSPDAKVQTQSKTPTTGAEKTYFPTASPSEPQTETQQQQKDYQSPIYETGENPIQAKSKTSI